MTGMISKILIQNYHRVSQCTYGHKPHTCSKIRRKFHLKRLDWNTTQQCHCSLTFVPSIPITRFGSTGTAPGNVAVRVESFLFAGGINSGGSVFGIVYFSSALYTRCIAYRRKQNRFYTDLHLSNRFANCVLHSKAYTPTKTSFTFQTPHSCMLHT